MKVGLIGNQNSGKTTLFNLLTGINQKVGNWPGVTIERKEGLIRGTDIQIVDLPGIYSLSPYTSEEEVSRLFIYEEKPNLIINIIDSTNLERSLYLTTQLLELDIKVVIVLNMTDLLEKKGVKIDIKELEKELNTTVVEISALKKSGIDKLIEVVSSQKYLNNGVRKFYSHDVETVVSSIEKRLDVSNKRFAAVNVFERNLNYVALLKDDMLPAIVAVEQIHDMDAEQLIASERYDFIEKIIGKVRVKTEISKKKSMTDKLDAIFLNKWAALPIFVVIMALIYFLSVGIVGTLTVDFMDSLFNGAESLELSFFGLTVWEGPFVIEGLGPWLGGVLEQWGASPWAVSLVADGIIAGVGAVCNFIPQLIILFICLSLLETTGYMSRISFFLDRIFIKFGLSGKSLIPFIVGSGCSVPAIMATRTIENEGEREATAILTPFIPCSAKLPIIALFAGYFFGNFDWLVSFSLYVFAIAVILLLALVLKKISKCTEESTYISELPEYRAPSFRYVGRDVFDKTMAFIKRAGTIVLLCSIAIWFLSSFTWTFQYIDGEELTINDNSMIQGIGNALAWIFYPMLGGNYSWGATVAALTGLAAKEQVVGTLEIISGLSDGDGAEIFGTTMFGFFNGWNSYAFMTFNLFSAPCFGAIGALRKELGSTKAMFKAIGLQTGLAWVLATVIGCIGWVVMLV